MPDWSYQTTFRPLLFRLPTRLGRDVALRAIGLLGKLPGGRLVIRLMGHTDVDQRLTTDVPALNCCVSSRVGLASGVDPHAQAIAAFSEFGFGFLEVGPVATASPTSDCKIRRQNVDESIQFSGSPETLLPIRIKEILARDSVGDRPVLIRCAANSAKDLSSIIGELQELAAAFVVDFSCLHDEMELPEEATILACIDPSQVDVSVDAEALQRVAQLLGNDRIAGVVVGAAITEQGWELGKTQYANSLAALRSLRESLPTGTLLVASVGIHAPGDALDCLDNGADLVQVNSGLVFAGPGLPKRINEALLYQEVIREPPPIDSESWAKMSWWWTLLIGAAMFLGGLLALGIAVTRVVLPYDEAMAGLNREQLHEVNDRLLSFMTHDRVTLSGTMLSVGILYSALALFGIRRGIHWAKVAVVTSALAGFATFFAFLGFGYFDPFHAFVTALLFQLTLMIWHADVSPRQERTPPDLWNDRRWLAGLWGQWMFVVHGLVLMTAGTVIISVGMTSVFVKEDLEFMKTTVEHLTAHPKLVPLVAHDRATFGGMLLTCGITTLLCALWGFRRGQRWLWWTLLLAGSAAYVATIIVHWGVGYHSLMHLLPAYGGLLWLWVGSVLSYPALAAGNLPLEEEWRRRVSG